jgi:hypothetical protein
VQRALVACAALAVGCGGDLDPPWQLDHDRIVAVRANPPGILPGEQATLDALIALKGAPTSVQVPEVAIVVAPESLAGALAFDGTNWVVTAPDAAALAAARTELGLPADAPVPLQVGVAYGAGTLAATKRVLLGMTSENPALTGMRVDGAPADAAAELVVGTLVDVPLAIEADDEDDVNWLSSCGTMHDFDLPQAYLRVEADDPHSGELAVIRRNPQGGVAWRVWSIRAE